MKRFVLILFLALCFCFAQSQINISGELRPRTEFRQGFRTMRGNESQPAFFTSQRSRINLNYKNDKSSSLISIQDVRIWGDEKFGSYNPSIALHLAWFKFSLSENIYLKLGRQTLDYDNKRLFSTANWSQVSKKHDAAKFGFSKGGIALDFVSAFNQYNENIFGTDYSNGQGNYKFLTLLWGKYTGENQVVEAFSYTDGYQKQTAGTAFTTTSGLITKIDFDKISGAIRAYYQGGELVNGTKVSAYLLHAEVFTEIENSKMTTGAELISGTNSTTSHGVSTTFESLYGGKHKFNGSMDYFKKSSDTQGTGLLDVYFLWHKKLSHYSELKADIHVFTSAMPYVDNGLTYGKYLASELDFSFKRKVSKEMVFEIGYSVLKGSATLEAMKGGDYDKLNHWAYAMLVFKPVFL